MRDFGRNHGPECVPHGYGRQLQRPQYHQQLQPVAVLGQPVGERAADYTKVSLTSGVNAFLLDAAFFIPEPPPRQPGYRLQRQK